MICRASLLMVSWAQAAGSAAAVLGAARRGIGYAARPDRRTIAMAAHPVP